MSFLYSLYFLLPSVVLTHVLFGKKASRWDLVASLGLALLVAGWGGYAIGMLRFGRYEHSTFWLLNIIFLLIALRNRTDMIQMFRRFILMGRPQWESLVIAALVVCGFAAGLLLFQTDAHSNTCLHTALSHAIGVPVADDQFSSSNRILFLQSKEREGAYALLAPFGLLFGFVGLRLFYAATIAFNGVFGFLLARNIFKGAFFTRFFATLLFIVLPFLSDMLWNDNNSISFFVATALAYLCFHPAAGPRSLGAFFAILVAVRHVSVLCLLGPVLAHIAWKKHKLQRGNTRKIWLDYLLAFLIVLFPVLAHHFTAFGSPFAFESFAEYQPHAHSFLGISFKLRGMLNFPFYPEIVRTPFNPLPLFLWVPVWFIARLGLLLSSLVVIGVLSSSSDWKKMLPFLAWTGPYLGMLLLNENWMQVEKMNIVAPVMPLVLLAALQGFTALGRAPSWVSRSGILLATILLMYVCVMGCTKLRFPYDPRFYEQYPWMLSEREEYLKAETDLVKAGLLPSPEWASMPRLHNRLEDLFRSFHFPLYRDRVPSPREQILEQIMPSNYANFVRQTELAPIEDKQLDLGDPVLLDIDLSRPWISGNDWIRRGTHRDDTKHVLLDLSEKPRPQVYRRFPLPWAPTHTATLTAFRRNDIVYVVLSGPNIYERDVDFSNLRPPPYEPITAAENPSPIDDKVSIRFPEKAKLRVIEFLSLDPARIYQWSSTSVKDPIELCGPIHWRHN